MKKLMLLGVLAAASGCSSQGLDWNSPTKKMTKEEMLEASARRGYSEIRKDKVIYVVSTPEAKKRVAKGQDPALKVAAIGFGPNGEKVIFEASKDGLENGLMKEFERRHGGAS